MDKIKKLQSCPSKLLTGNRSNIKIGQSGVEKCRINEHIEWINLGCHLLMLPAKILLSAWELSSEIKAYAIRTVRPQVKCGTYVQWIYRIYHFNCIAKQKKFFLLPKCNNNFSPGENFRNAITMSMVTFSIICMLSAFICCLYIWAHVSVNPEQCFD